MGTGFRQRRHAARADRLTDAHEADIRRETSRESTVSRTHYRYARVRDRKLDFVVSASTSFG